jgi:nucleoside-diphosphate-sugar epimerase
MIIDFVEEMKEEDRFAYVIINAGFMIGKSHVKYPKTFTSQDKIQKILEGKYPGLPDIYVPTVNVEEVAEAHLLAVTNASTSGRYIFVEGNLFHVKI